MAEYENTFEGLSMPYSLDSEQSVLGAILLDPSCITSDGVQQLRPEHFYLPQHSAIFSAMYTMFSSARPIDPVTLLEELRSTGEYETAGGKEYLTRLAQIVPSVENVKSYADTVLEKYYIRSLIRAGRQTVEQAQEAAASASDLIDAAEQRIFEIRQGKDVANLTPIKQIITSENSRISSLSDPEVRKLSRGIPLGLSGIDAVLGGMNRSDLIIIGARPGVGKTSFSLNIARNAAVNSGKRVAFFSLEMSKEQLVSRLLSSESAIESQKLRWGGLSGDDEWERLANASANLYKTEMFIDDTAAITVPQMKAKLRRNKVDLVFIDYLQLIEPVNKRTDNRVQQVSEITRALKVMAKELDIPIVVCSQLSRTPVQGKARAPQLSDLRESGSIEQDADIVMLLYRVDDSQQNDDPDAPAPDTAQCIIAKNRHGATGVVDLKWNGKYFKYETVETELEYEY